MVQRPTRLAAQRANLSIQQQQSTYLNPLGPRPMPDHPYSDHLSHNHPRLINENGVLVVEDEDKEMSDQRLKLDPQCCDPYHTIVVAPDHPYHIVPDDQIAYRGASYIYENSYSSPYYQHYQPVQSQSPVTQSSYAHLHTQRGSPASNDDESAAGNSIGHTARTPPATLEWLNNNYEQCDGASLPRCTLYEHYQKHCEESELEPVNAASFGKLIRSVFKGLRTRRLGTRGNSKYHYNGIRIKPSSRLLQSVSAEEFTRMNPNGNGNHQTARSTRRTSTNNHSGARSSSSASSSSYKNETNSFRFNGQFSSGYDGMDESFDGRLRRSAVPIGPPTSKPRSEEPIEPYNFGDVELPDIRLEDVNEMETHLTPNGLSVHDAMKFAEQYSANCVEVFETVKVLQFGELQRIWSNFWQNPENASNGRTEKSQLHRLCSIPQVQKFIYNSDISLYQSILDYLVPNVLSRSMEQINSSLRSLSKDVEGMLSKAMTDVPEEIRRSKIETIRLLAYCLRRYAMLNHLVCAARKTFEDDSLMNHMYRDYCNCELSPEASWVTNCDSVLVQSIQNDFKEKLQCLRSVEDWAQWIEKVLDQVLAKCHDKPAAEQANVAKNFLLRWSYFSNSVIRSITLRAADSFASFHLVRFLYEDYMLHLIHDRLAKSLNQPLICTIKEYFPPLKGDSMDLGESYDLNRDSLMPLPNGDYVEENKFPEMDQNMEMMCSENGNYIMVPNDEFLADEGTHPVIYVEEERPPFVSASNPTVTDSKTISIAQL